MVSRIQGDYSDIHPMTTTTLPETTAEDFYLNSMLDWTNPELANLKRAERWRPDRNTNPSSRNTAHGSVILNSIQNLIFGGLYTKCFHIKTPEFPLQHIQKIFFIFLISEPYLSPLGDFVFCAQIITLLCSQPNGLPS